MNRRFRLSALELLRQNARKVDRTRTAERPPRDMAEAIGRILHKVWENIPRVVFGPEYAPKHERDGMEMGR